MRDTKATALRRGAVAFTCLALFSGCGPFDSEDNTTSDGWRHHTDGEGILSVGSGDGGALSLHSDKPTGEPWSATFGVFVMCTDGGEPAQLDSVTWSAQGDGAVVVPYLRAIPPEEQRSARRDYAPGAVRGTPASARPRLGGEFVQDLKGRTVDTDCADPPTPAQAREDLVMVVTAGRAGAKVDGITMRYTAGGKRYALDVNYTLVLCGDGVSDPEC